MNTTTNDKAVTVEVIRDRQIKRGANVFPGQIACGHRAEIVPGKSITLHGAIAAGKRYVLDESTGRRVPNARPLLYCTHFEIGDVAAVGGMNLTYMGRIRSITAKTVTVVENEGTRNEKAHRLSLYRFDDLNWDFDATEAARRNSEWMD